MELIKPKRIVCKKTIAKYRGVTCQACGKANSSNPAHIKSRGAGGDDTDNNLLALCFNCHRAQHDYGWSYFLNEHPKLRIILKQKGWIIGPDKKLMKHNK